MLIHLSYEMGVVLHLFHVSVLAFATVFAVHMKHYPIFFDGF